jgi:hypothetical protein
MPWKPVVLKTMGKRIEFVWVFWGEFNELSFQIHKKLAETGNKKKVRIFLGKE